MRRLTDEERKARSKRAKDWQRDNPVRYAKSQVEYWQRRLEKALEEENGNHQA